MPTLGFLFDMFVLLFYNRATGSLDSRSPQGPLAPSLWATLQPHGPAPPHPLCRGSQDLPPALVPWAVLRGQSWRAPLIKTLRPRCQDRLWLPGEGLSGNRLQGEQNRVLGMQAPLNAFLMATGAGAVLGPTRAGQRRGRLWQSAPCFPVRPLPGPPCRKAHFFFARVLSVSPTALCAGMLTTDY